MKTINVIGLFMLGFLIGCLLTFTALQPSITTPSTDNDGTNDMVKFLVSLHQGQAKHWIELPKGVFRVGPKIDKYHTVLFQIIPVGDIPLLVRDVPENFIKDGMIYNDPPSDDPY